MSMKRLFGGTAFEAQIHLHHSECKNVQKPVTHRGQYTLCHSYFSISLIAGIKDFTIGGI